MIGYICSTQDYERMKRDAGKHEKNCDLFWAAFFKEEKKPLTEEQKKALKECRWGNHFK